MKSSSNLTMHQISMAAKNSVRPKRRDQRIAVTPDGVTVPKIGTEIEINLDLVMLEDDEGRPKTPMTKLRFNDATKQWQQISANLAGMLAFFDTPPDDDCTRIRVVRVIPSGRACYVVPV